MQVNFGETEIKNLLNKVRIFNKDLGDYQMFAITGEFDYVVKLSNGKITISIDELQDDVNDSITPEQLSVIAKRFKNTTQISEPETEETKTAIPNPEIKTTQETENAIPKQKKSSIPQQNKTVESKKSKTWLYLTLAAILITVMVVWYNQTNGSNDDHYDYAADMPRDNSEYSEEIMNDSEDSYQTTSRQKTEAELRQELVNKEERNPKKYLSADYTWRVNLAANTIIEGNINNSATVAGFKNVEIKLFFYSKTDVLLDTETFTVMEFVPPGSSASFRHKIYGWSSEASSCKYKIIAAEPY